ncbi:MAG: DNA primase [Aquificota bacterium]|nr:MAG: DNA primase [Aquificota bacterium]
MASVRDLLNKIDIVEVISSYIQLKRVGNNYAARCPFHPDDTPSFYVSPSKGIFKCFGCGVGGDAVKFVALYENIDYKEALLKLAQKYKVPISIKTEKKEDRVYLALERVLRFYEEELSYSKSALEYLSERGITSWAVERFNLGFGGDTQKLIKVLKEEGLLELYEKTGNLVKLDEDAYRDLFKGRVVLPIRDIKGRVVAFGARAIDGSKPKYINSPESEFFKKRQTLFGLYQAKDYIKELGQAVLVEGYFDVISLHQEGIRNVVAPLGTAFTQEHAKLLSPLCKEVLLLYDGDEAGRRAVRLSVPLLLQEGLEVRVVYLPQGEDPDSFVKKAKKELKRLLERAMPIEVELLQKVKEGNRQALEDLLYFAGFIKDSIKRYEVLKDVSQATGLAISSLLDRLPKVAKAPEKEGEGELSFHEKVLLACALRFGAQGVPTQDLRLSPYALELLEAIREGNYHLLPESVKSFKVYNLERAFEESLKALSYQNISLEEQELSFKERAKRSMEQPRKLRIKRL